MVWVMTLLQLHFLRLPSDIASHHVILMDATVATGSAAIMAIRILLVSQFIPHVHYLPSSSRTGP